MQKATPWVIGIAVAACIAVFVAMVMNAVAPPLQAQSAPNYGTYRFATGQYSGVASTVAEELLPAPGANYRWVITGLNREVLVAEASKVISIVDHSGSTPGGVAISTGGALVESAVVCEFAPTIAGNGVTHTFGEGFTCAVNSAVVIEGVSTSADIWVQIEAYKEYVP